ncbi:MAG: transposase [Mogibacterium sp.]|nr:transposase [Mogibacterium sp.]
MQITLTSKLQILPDEETKEHMLETMRVFREACNYVSRYVYNTQNMSPKDLQNALYYKLRTKFNIRSQMAISVLRTVRARYNTLETNKHPWKLIFFNKLQLDLVWNRDYSLLGDVFSINTLNGRKKVPILKTGETREGKYGTASLIYRQKKFFLYIPVTFEVKDANLRDISNVVGVDRGIRFIATTYDTKGKTTFYSGAKVEARKEHFEKIRKSLQVKHTASSRKRLKAICRREHRWMQDVNHCISKALTESQPAGTLFVLEDLSGISGRSRHFPEGNRKSICYWSYFDLEEKLYYKAALRGQIVIKVNPSYTSQTCPLCGRRNKASRIKSKHIFRCFYCRYKSNDDRVAAINLYSKGVQYLVQTGESMPLFGGA